MRHLRQVIATATILCLAFAPLSAGAADLSAALTPYIGKSALVSVVGTTATASMTSIEVGSDYLKLRSDMPPPNTGIVWYVPFSSVGDVRVITTNSQDSVRIRLR